MEKTLTHYGVLGMKWGVRRYQNKDGTLTEKGRKRYEKDAETLKKRIKNEKGDIAYLKEAWREEGHSKKDIDLGLEEYKLSLKRMEQKLWEINRALSNDKPITAEKVDKLQKKIESARSEGLAYAEKKRAAIQKDIDSFAPFMETGIRDKSGRLMLSPDDVAASVAALQKLKDKI